MRPCHSGNESYHSSAHVSESRLSFNQWLPPRFSSFWTLNSPTAIRSGVLVRLGRSPSLLRDRHEAAAISHSDSDVSAVTSRGGIRISPSPNIRLVASETATRTSWNHRVALCLREEDSAMTQRDVLTELGTDTQSLRDCDRDAILFDLGLAAHQIDACVRVSDPAVVADLRACSGRNVFEAGNPAMRVIVSASPHRVFVSRIGRIEVFQPIPPPGGSSPEGPHTHVLPKLLQHRRTHPATEQVPPQLCALCAFLSGTSNKGRPRMSAAIRCRSPFTFSGDVSSVRQR